jgi:hypothetical protein
VSETQNGPTFRDSDWKKLVVSSSRSDDPDLGLDVLDGKSGWYIPLTAGKTYREYVTASPLISGNTLYIATFIEKVIDIFDAGHCESRRIAGDSRLYAVDLRSGRGNKWSDGSKYFTVEGVKITGLTESKQGHTRHILVTYDKLTNENNLDKLGLNNVNHIQSDGLDVLDIEDREQNSVVPLNPGANVIMYWSKN